MKERTHDPQSDAIRIQAHSRAGGAAYVDGGAVQGHLVVHGAVKGQGEVGVHQLAVHTAHTHSCNHPQQSAPASFTHTK